MVNRWVYSLIQLSVSNDRRQPTLSVHPLTDVLTREGVFAFKMMGCKCRTRKEEEDENLLLKTGRCQFMEEGCEALIIGATVGLSRSQGDQLSRQQCSN